MDLNMVQNSTFSYNYQNHNLNNHLKNDSKIEPSQNSSKIDSKLENISQLSAKVNTNEKFSNISNDIKNSISNIKKLEMSQSLLSQQNDLVNQLQTTTSNLNETDLNSKAVKVNSIITQYNSNSNKIYSNLQEYYNEQKSDKSQIYFDGVLGSIPLSSQEIFEAIQKQKSAIEVVNNEINQFKEKEIEYSKKVIQEQENENSFAKIDFEAVNIKENLQNSMTKVQMDIPSNLNHFEITA